MTTGEPKPDDVPEPQDFKLELAQKVGSVKHAPLIVSLCRNFICTREPKCESLPSSNFCFQHFLVMS